MSIRVAAYSDVTCPWCFVGKRRLDKVKRTVRIGHKFVKQKSRCWVYSSIILINIKFFIDVKISPEGEDSMKYLIKKFGSDELAKDLKKAGAPDGITFGKWKLKWC